MATLRNSAWSDPWTAATILAGSLLCLLASTDRCPASQLEEMAKKAGYNVLAEGDSSSERQRDTRSQIPLNRLSQENRQRALHVLDSCNQYRSLPELQYSVDQPMYQYLISHPDVAVSSWRVMQISRFQMWQTGPMDYEAEAVDGSEGIADVLLRDDSQCLFICEGSYRNPLMPKPLEASALVWLRYAFAELNGATVVRQKLDVFVAFPSAGVSTVARVLTPVTNSMMDRNAFEVSLYAGMMSRAVQTEPEWVVQVAQQLDGVLPQRREELLSIARLPRVRQARSRPPAGAADRQNIISSGISLFEPPDADSVLAAGAGSPHRGSVTLYHAGPTAPVPATSVSTRGAAGEPPVRIAPAATMRVLPSVESTDSGPIRIENSDPFVLQPVVVPPVSGMETSM